MSRSTREEPTGSIESASDPPAASGQIRDEGQSLVASETVAGRGPGSILDVAPPRGPSFLRGFRALRHRDYALFFSGQFISLIGTWMQSLAQSWLVLVLTNSALALGIVGAVQFLPVLFFSAFGGAIADRAPKRMILIGTQTAEMILAFILAFLVVRGEATFGHVLILAFLLGVANSIDMPTRQSFVPDLVGPDDLLNAIALNSALFNSARVIGPAIGGVLIGVIGIAGCFFLNGLSFLPVIAGLCLMNPVTRPRQRFESMGDLWADLREGFAYVRSHQVIRNVVILVGVIGTFGLNFNVVAPILAQQTLKVGATGLGWLMAAMGAGSLAGSLALAYASATPHPRLLTASAFAFSVFEIALAKVATYASALVLFVLIGAAMVTFSALANTLIQLTVPSQLRGRVMSIYTTVFVGTTPIGNTRAGLLAEATGAFGPLFYGGLASLLATAWFAMWTLVTGDE